MKRVREHIDEEFKENSDPIKDMDIGSLKVFVIRVNLVDEEWQISKGVDIVIARTEKQAISIWKKTHKEHYFHNAQTEIEEIKELDITKIGYHHIEDAAVE
jgi:hypothetical protein